jgi:hypothetical protein
MVGETFQTIASQFGMPTWLLIVILAWIVVWKMIALWKSARKGHIIWFIAIAFINTIGILEILYVFVFSKLGVVKHKVVKKISKKKRR